MAEQLQKLEDLAVDPNIELHILPFSSITYAGLEGSYVILDLPDGTEFVYLEAPTISQLVSARDNITECRVRFDQVMGAARSREDSLAMIRRAREAL
jgi:hypothetical protein